MADLLGIPSSQDDQEVVDYLGRPVPISLKGQPALPVGGPPVSAAVGPSGRVGVSGRALAGAGEAGAPGEAAGGPDKTFGLIQQGLKLADVARKLFGDRAGFAGRSPESEEAFQAQRAGERAPAIAGAGAELPVATFAGKPITAAQLAALRELGFGAITEPLPAATLTGAEASAAAAAEQGATGAEAAGAGAGGILGGLNLSDLAPYLAYATAAYKIGQRAAAGEEGAGEQAGKAAVEAAAAAAAPFTFGLSMLAPMVLEIVGQETPFFVDPLAHLLYGGGRYAPVRQQAARETRGGLTSLHATYSKAVESGDPGEVLKALSSGEVDNRIRSELWLPAEVAQSMGVTAFGEAGDRARVSWGDVTPEQFTRLLDHFEANPDALGPAIVGSGDVPYLGQAQAQQVADQVATGSRALLSYMVNLRAAERAFAEAQTAAIPEAAPMLAEAATAPPAATTPGGGGTALTAELLGKEPPV